MHSETKKQISLGIIISYLVIVVQFLTGLVYTPIVLKTLGQQEYGVYSLCTSFMGYFTIMNGGANAAYVRFYVQTKVNNPEKIPGLNGVFLKIFSALALIALVGGWIVAIFSQEIFGNKISTSEYILVKECFVYLSFMSAAQVINCVFSSLVIANEKFIFGKIINLLVAIINPVVTIPFLLAGYNCVIIVIIHMISMIVTLAVNLFYCIKKLKTKFLLKNKDQILLKRIAQFAGFIVLQNIMDQMNWQIDKFILARTHGTDEISLYSVGATFNKYYIMFSGALSGVFIAQINKMQAKEDRNRINLLFIKSSRLFAYLIWLFMSAFAIFGKPFVSVWAGKEYEQSYFIGILLMLPITVSLTMGLGQDVARAMNKHQLQIVLNLIVCIINVLVSIPLAIRLGALGSAIGTFAAEIVMCIILEPIYYQKYLGLDIIRVLKNLLRLLVGIIIPSVYGILINVFDLVKSSYVSIAVYGTIYLIVYAFSMWFFAMNNDEKSIVAKVVRKIIPQRK